MKFKLDNPVSGIRRLFGGAEEPTPERKGRRGHWAVETMDFSFLTLAEILRTEPGSLGATLHIISLRSMKEALGEEWSQYVNKVQMIAESVVRRHVGRKGTAGTQDDDTFVLSFASMAADEAQALCRAIAVDFMKILIGDRFSDAAIRIGEVDRDRVVRQDGSLDTGAMDAAIDRSESNVLTASGELVAGGGGAAASAAVSAPHLSRGGGGRLAAVEGTAKRRDPRWQPLAWPPADLKRPGALAIPPVDPEDDVPPGLSLGFRPVWSRRRAMVDAFRIVPVSAMPAAGAGVGSEDAAAGDPPPPRIAEAEELCLAPDARAWQRINVGFAVLFLALQQIERNIEAGRPMEMVVPLPFAATVMPARAILEDVLKYFADAARARNLYLELVDIPNSIEDAALAEAVRWLQGLCRDVLASSDSPHGPVRLGMLVAARPRAIGCDLSGRRFTGSADPFIVQFARALGSAQSYFWGLDPGGFRAALEAGAVFVNGDAARPDDLAAARILDDPLAPATV